MKRILTYMLILSFALSCACSASHETGSDACRRFLDNIAKYDFDAAYDMLSESVKNTSTETVLNKLTRQEFVTKYTNIFTELDIQAAEYTITNIGGGELFTKIDYSMAYVSGLGVTIESEYSMSTQKEKGEWKIDWTPALIFPEMDFGDTVRVTRIAAKRGEILARGAALAKNDSAQTVYAVISELDSNSYPMLINTLSEVLDMPVQKVSDIIENPFNDVAVIKSYYPGTLKDDVIERLSSLQGIRIGTGFKNVRTYPFDEIMAHFIGYLGMPQEDELKALNEGRTEADGLYTTDSAVGRLGLESLYESEMRGSDGSMIYISNAEGENKRTLYKAEARDGLDVNLTVDADLEERVYELLENTLYGEEMAGAVVVMDPTTGRVDAIASYPSYDLNLFSRGITQSEYESITSKKNTPLYNRAIQGLYPPGSVFKPITAAAALKYGAVSEDFVFNEKIVNNYWTPTTFGTWVWPAIKRTSMNNRTEPMNMRNSMLNSDNIYFAYTALTLGEERLEKMAESFGFGTAIPFELSVQKSQFANDDVQMYPKLLADSGYGQGEILITPLQMAATFCAFRTGDIPIPYIVDGLYYNDATEQVPVSVTEPKTYLSDVCDKEVFDRLLPMLKDVVDSRYNGTGSRLRVKNCVVAGKTGTAEVGSDKNKEISWFVGFRTGVSSADERLVLVMLELPNDKSLSGIKLDIARDLLELEAAVADPTPSPSIPNVSGTPN